MSSEAISFTFHHGCYIKRVFSDIIYLLSLGLYWNENFFFSLTFCISSALPHASNLIPLGIIFCLQTQHRIKTCLSFPAAEKYTKSLPSLHTADTSRVMVAAGHIFNFSLLSPQESVPRCRVRQLIFVAKFVLCFCLHALTFIAVFALYLHKRLATVL